MSQRPADLLLGARADLSTAFKKIDEAKNTLGELEQGALVLVRSDIGAAIAKLGTIALLIRDDE